jgi:tetratricopeptide (TPR) repeat protein
MNPVQGRDYYQAMLHQRRGYADAVQRETTALSAAAAVSLLASPGGRGPFLVAAVDLHGTMTADDARRDLAGPYQLVGGAEFRLHNFAATEEYTLKAVELLQQKVAAHPDQLRAQQELAQAHERLGDLYLRTNRADLASREYEAMQHLCEGLVAKDQKVDGYKTDLANAFYDLGNAALRRGDKTLAAQNYLASLEIREARVRGPHPDLGARKEVMVTLAHCGQHRRAADIAAQVRQEAPNDSWAQLDVACCYAICSGGVGPEEAALREQYVGLAMEALQKLITLGYRNVVNLETEPDLDAVRDRPEFKAVVAELSRLAGE